MLEDDLGHLGQIVVQLVHELFGLHPFRRRGEAPDVGEEDGEELPTGRQGDIALAREDRLGELRREVALEARCALELRDLRVNRGLQTGVEGLEFRIQRRQLLRRAVEVAREVPELIAIGYGDARQEIAVRDPVEPPVDPSDRPDE